MTRLVGITGGIGAGKSVVSRILRAMGYPVYDCDSRAKAIMDGDPRIHEQLCRQIHPHVVADGCIDRSLLSEIVFNDAEALCRLNSIVHAAVEADVRDWISRHDSPLSFVESAILYKCRLAEMVCGVIEVTAPVELRVKRVMARSALSRQQVMGRISAQNDAGRRHDRSYYIINDGEEAVLPQLKSALKIFQNC